MPPFQSSHAAALCACCCSGPARAGSGLPKEWVLQLGAGAEGHNSSGGSSPSRMLRQARRRRACTTSLTREQLRLAAEQSRAALAAHGSAQVRARAHEPQP